MVGESKESCFDEFVVAREQLEKLISELRSESARILEHGEVESLISREGKELLRRLMQGYLDQRTAAEERYEGVSGADGEERRHCRARSRSLVTLFGDVEVRRLGYSGARLKSVFPLDAALWAASIILAGRRQLSWPVKRDRFNSFVLSPSLTRQEKPSSESIACVPEKYQVALQA